MQAEYWYDFMLFSAPFSYAFSEFMRGRKKFSIIPFAIAVLLPLLNCVFLELELHTAQAFIYASPILFIILCDFKRVFE